MKINEMSVRAHKNASKKGFWDMERRVLRRMKNDGFDEEEIKAVELAFKSQKLMLVVTEIGEAVEALRKEDEGNLKEEIADTFIRLGDFVGGYDINSEAAIDLKMTINETRPKLHGKKF